MVQPPSSVTIQSNNTSASFSIPTSAVSSVHSVTLTATLGSRSLTSQVSIVPPIQVTLSPASVIGGATVTGTVTLGNPAPSTGATISVISNTTSVAPSPGVFTISPGDTTATFTIVTETVTSARTVTLTATDAANSATATLTVNPQTTGQLQSLSISPAQVTGGAKATGTIAYAGPAPANGQVVSLKTSNALVATVPQIVTIAAGSTTATFPIATSAVASTQAVTITATAGATSETAILTVVPN